MMRNWKRSWLRLDKMVTMRGNLAVSHQVEGTSSLIIVLHSPRLDAEPLTLRKGSGGNHTLLPLTSA
jgi:hypothetical protein